MRLDFSPAGQPLSTEAYERRRDAVTARELAKLLTSPEFHTWQEQRARPAPVRWELVFGAAVLALAALACTCLAATAGPASRAAALPASSRAAPVAPAAPQPAAAFVNQSSAGWRVPLEVGQQCAIWLRAGSSRSLPPAARRRHPSQARPTAAPRLTQIPVELRREEALLRQRLVSRERELSRVRQELEEALDLSSDLWLLQAASGHGGAAAAAAAPAASASMPAAAPAAAATAPAAPLPPSAEFANSSQQHLQPRLLLFRCVGPARPACPREATGSEAKALQRGPSCACGSCAAAHSLWAGRGTVGSRSPWPPSPPTFAPAVRCSTGEDKPAEAEPPTVPAGAGPAGSLAARGPLLALLLLGAAALAAGGLRVLRTLRRLRAASEELQRRLAEASARLDDTEFKKVRLYCTSHSPPIPSCSPPCLSVPSPGGLPPEQGPLAWQRRRNFAAGCLLQAALCPLRPCHPCPLAPQETAEQSLQLLEQELQRKVAQVDELSRSHAPTGGAQGRRLPCARTRAAPRAGTKQRGAQARSRGAPGAALRLACPALLC